MEAFPYLYGILKAHKQPVQLRYIAGCSRKGAAILEKAKESEEVEKETAMDENPESIDDSLPAETPETR